MCVRNIIGNALCASRVRTKVNHFVSAIVALALKLLDSNTCTFYRVSSHIYLGYIGQQDHDHHLRQGK